MGATVRVAARVFAAALVCLLCCSAFASKDAALLYRGAGEGKVIFDGRLHASKGYSCNDCHKQFAATGTRLFSTQKRALIDMPAHKSGGQCFACHDGKTASKECESCHRENAP